MIVSQQEAVLCHKRKIQIWLSLIRGKTGRVYGNLIGLLTVLKGLPLAYNKDMQEDKEGMFDTVKTVTGSLKIFAGMIQTMKVRTENDGNKQQSKIFLMQQN